jgi:ribosomal-protein-alanine N-acetyltransferase
VPFLDPGPIESARLVVRLITEADPPALLPVNGDDEVTRFLPYATWRSEADAQAWYQRILGLQAAGGTLQFVIADKASGELVGSCLLFRFDASANRAELGYVLGRAHWGRGLMREAVTALIDTAFGRMALRRLEAEVDPRNTASCQLLLRLGFTQEGLLRQRWVTKGEPKDVNAFGLLRHEWPPVAADPAKAGKQPAGR